MQMLKQCFDIDGLLAGIHAAHEASRNAVSESESLDRADDAAALAVDYWMCRAEGMEEPCCFVVGFDSADAYVSAVTGV